MKFRGDQIKLFKLASDLKIKKIDIAKHLDISPQSLTPYSNMDRELPRESFNILLDLVLDTAATSKDPEEERRLKRVQDLASRMA